ncbi:hypothetical protein BgiBS90_017100 [Biomphalaria glabrata]|nr:hypothetical protein BgiBS90_017100 [Biomphalaria glabrata]
MRNLIACILTVLVAHISSAPLTETTVDNPCNSYPAEAAELVPLRDWLLWTLTQINEASATFQRVSDAFVRAGIVASEITKYKQLRLPSLPIREDAPADQGNVTLMEELRRDYRNLVIYVRFLQAFIADQQAYAPSKLVSEMRECETYFFRILCLCEHLLRSNNISRTTDVNASLVPPSLKQISDDKNQLLRNYMFVNQSIDYLKSMAVYFKKVETSMRFQKQQ